MPDMNPLHWGREKDMTEMEFAVGHAVATADAGRSQSDVEHEKQLAENAILMTDPELERLITGLCAYSRPEVCPTTGEILYEEFEQTEEGKVSKVKRPKMETGFVTQYVALRVLASRLVRSGYLSPLDASLARVRVRCILRRIQMKMTESDYEKGGRILIESIGQILDGNISCSINGRMSLVMKSNPRSYEVRVGKTAEQRGV